MMLVIHRSNGGMRRYYQGSGMFGELGRQLFSSGIKKAISSGASSTILSPVLCNLLWVYRDSGRRATLGTLLIMVTHGQAVVPPASVCRKRVG